MKQEKEFSIQSFNEKRAMKQRMDQMELDLIKEKQIASKLKDQKQGQKEKWEMSIEREILKDRTKELESENW